MAITFFKTPQQSIIATESAEVLTKAEIEKLWTTLSHPWQ